MNNVYAESRVSSQDKDNWDIVEDDWKSNTVNIDTKKIEIGSLVKFIDLVLADTFDYEAYYEIDIKCVWPFVGKIYRVRDINHYYEEYFEVDLEGVPFLVDGIFLKLI